MALRTISATGGNFGSVSAWIEGVVPTSSDHVVGDASSGNLTLNTSYTVQYVDFTNYTAQFNLSNFSLTLGLANATSSFGASMSFTYSQTGYAGADLGNYGRFICNVAHGFSQSGTVQIPQLTLGAGTKTLGTDIYVFRLRNNATNLTCNGNILHVFEAILGVTDASGGNGNTYLGTTKIIAKGSGTPGQFNALTIFAAFTTTLEIQGQNYITMWGPITLNSGGTLITTTASDPSRCLVNLNNSETTTPETYNFNMAQPVHAIRVVNYFGTSVRFSIINTIGEGLKANYFYLIPFANSFYGGERLINKAETVRFQGVGASVSNILSYPAFRYSNQFNTFPSLAESLYTLAPSLQFDNLGTYSIGNFVVMGADGSSLISSQTASLDAKIISYTNSYIFNTSVTDIDASGGSTLYVYNIGTVSSSTNVQNFPGVGGTGGGGTAAGPYAFAFIS